MEKSIKKHKRKIKLTIPLVIILLLLIGINIYLYLNNKSLSKEYETLNKNYQNNNENYNSENIKLQEIQKKIASLNNLKEDTTKIKDELFKDIKSLEDNILNGKSNSKIAYLTFDDGPYYNTYKFLDVLDKYNVKATFFTTSINGTNCFDDSSKNCMALYKEYVKRGHTIANHTYTHGIFKGLYSSVDSFINAVKKQEEKVKTETDGYVTNIVRFPGGSVTAGRLKSGIVNELKKLNYGYVDWTAEDGDGGNLTSKEQAWSTFTSTINEKIEVVLFHDFNNYTLSILPDAIKYLQDKGYILLPLFYESNMVKKG